MASPTLNGVAELAHRIDELEMRMRQLEDRVAAGTASPFQDGSPPTPELAPELHLEDAERLIPLLGKALLALAGAYLLRALSTSSLAPPWVGVSLALAYSAFWLFWATRFGASNKLAGAFYMTTAVLALGPMLWETTVRFHMLPPSGAAAALAGFVVLSLLLSWRQQTATIAWLGSAAGAMAALALAAGTDDLLPFCASLLTIAAAFEVAAFQGFWMGPASLVACAADLSVLWMVYIGSLRHNWPEGYAPFTDTAGWAMPASLFALYATATVRRTLGRKLEVTAFEIFQLLASFGLFLFAATGGMESHALLGGLLVIFGATCYAISFGWLIQGSQRRNLHLYSIFGLGLTLLGTVFLFHRPGMSIVWAFASVGIAALGTRTGGMLGACHGIAFLAASGIASGLAWDTFCVLLGDGMRVAFTPATLITCAAIAGVYLLVGGIPRAMVAVMLSWIMASGCASVLLIGLGAEADPAWGAAIRTALVIACAVAVAAIGRRWRCAELYWLAPGAMVIALYRLIADDFRSGRPETLFLSLLFYGGALLLLSRLMRGWRRA